MRKNILDTLHSYLNGDTTVDITEARDYINSEYAKQASAAKSKADAYETAKPLVLAAIAETAMTAKDIYESVADSLPDGFTAAKIQYGLLHYWMDEVEKIPGEGKAPNTYKARA